MATSYTTSTHVIADIRKEITFNRETRDYDMHIVIDEKREYIGSAATHGQAETACNSYVYEYLMDSHTIETAAALLMEQA